MSDVGGCSSNDDRLHALLYFLGQNCEKGVSVASLNSKMADLAFLFKLGGVEGVTKAFIVRKALRGYRKGLTRPDSRRLVLLGILEVLAGVFPQVCFSPFEVQLYKMAFVVAFFRVLRVAELVSPSKSVTGGLDVSDVSGQQSRLRCLFASLRRTRWEKGPGLY